MTSRRVEAELKYTASDELPLRELETAEMLGPARLGIARTVPELDRYLDTHDLRLAAAHWACRLRSRDGRTVVSLKGPPEHEPGDPLHLREEVEGPAGHGLQPLVWPPSPARDLLLAVIGDGALAERFRLEQDRTERTVSVESRLIGALSLDRVQVKQGQVEAGRMLVVELELDPAAVAAGFDYQPLSRALGRVRGLVADGSSKFERALALLPAE